MKQLSRKWRNRCAILSIGIGSFLFLSLFVCIVYFAAADSILVPEGEIYAPNQKEVLQMIDVPYLSQDSDFPTGCESVSAVMVLQYYGKNISPEDFIENYLIQEDFWEENGVRIGPSPWEAFVGSPYSSNSYGCYAPVIVDALRKACPTGFDVRNEMGSSLNKLVEIYIDTDIPVLIWATMDMKESYKSDQWQLENGETFTWIAGEHCLVLVGYDEDAYYFNDPYQNHGVVGYDKKTVEKRYRELGRQAVVLVAR
jgi:uncharacterized protein YvpB